MLLQEIHANQYDELIGRQSFFIWVLKHQKFVVYQFSFKRVSYCVDPCREFLPHCFHSHGVHTKMNLILSWGW